MIGLSLTSTVRRVEAEREQARRHAEWYQRKVEGIQALLNAAEDRNVALIARVATLQDQIDALPTRAANGRFVRRDA